MANPRGRKGDRTVSKSERADHSTGFATDGVVVTIADLAKIANVVTTVEQSPRHKRIEVNPPDLSTNHSRVAGRQVIFSRGFTCSEGFVPPREGFIPTRNVEGRSGCNYTRYSSFVLRS